MEHEERISIIRIDDYERQRALAGCHGCGICSDHQGDDEYDSLSSNRFRFLQAAAGSGMRRLEEKELEHEIVAKSFVSGLGSLGRDVEVVAVHKNNWSKAATAREEAFRIFSDAVATKCGGNANIKFAWYGGPMDEICQILSHGFSNNNNKHIDYGVGVYLSPARFSNNSFWSSTMDENGLRHMLLCRVILGKVEAIPAGSTTQFHPTSNAFDTAVDNLFAPTKYIVWPAFMNSHIQPTYVVSFKAPKNKKSVNINDHVVKPTSPWMSFSTLMSALSRFLDPRKMGLIQKCHKDFIRNKIRRPQLINRVRHIAGDDLLIALIKKYKRNQGGAKLPSLVACGSIIQCPLYSKSQVAVELRNSNQKN